MLAEQSAERDFEKRRRMVWDIERLLAEENVRPMMYHGRTAQCRQAWVKGHVSADNSIYSHWRHEQVWLDK